MLTFHQVVRLFNEAAQMSPEDADVHIVLGVLYNLSREYDKAIASFKTALQLKPQDYSLWNKLGATQANSIQSADAILAYQKVISSNTYLNFQLWSFFLVDNPVYILV
jgi:peroxin-5